MKNTEVNKLTAEDLEHRLAQRYCQPEWAFFSQVRSSTGLANRVADGVAMNMYASRKHEIHGFEIKISRSDWLSELKKPQKADEIFRYCDKWWLVVSDKDIVQKGELPKGWGLIIPRGKGLIVKVKAEYIEADVISLGFIASLLRNATDQMIPRNTISQQIDAAYKNGEESKKWEIERLENSVKKYKEIIEKFEKEVGMEIDIWYGSNDIEKIGKIIKKALQGEKFNIKYDIDDIECRTRHILDEVEKIKNITNE